MRHALALAVAGLLLTGGAQACVVRAVHDGDTLTAACPEGRLRVRLREIDAPERTQPYARISANSLKAMCLGRTVRLDERALDRYGRTLARVTCGRTDANAAQVRRGLAWAFTRYLTDPRIAALEAEARAARRGLWRDPAPVAPWDFRHFPPS